MRRNIANHILFRQAFNLKELETKYPPKFINHNKKLILSRLPEQTGDYDKQELRVSKWQMMDFPTDLPKQQTNQILQIDSFSYEPSAEKTTSWHVNFADTRLFGFYHGGLFAQDEIQVMEHPCLGSLKDCLTEMAYTTVMAAPHTRRNGNSTPILIQGARRRVAVATDVNAEEGRPGGLYGRMFAVARDDTIIKALRIIDPPTVTNLIAIEAPKGGHGEYSRAEIADAFGTAFSGFKAAKLESVEADPATRVVIHTGNWGTGAFGGNKVLMAFLQMLAAHAAEVHDLVYHSFDGPSALAYNEGKEIFDQYLTKQPSVNVDKALEDMYRKKFVWGVSDGN